MESQIQEFYKDKTIFLTGGSGLMGRVTIEKMLRSTDVTRIYVLMRPKRGKSPQERIESWNKSSLFGLLLKTQPNALKRVVSIPGDCEEPDLGISFADRETLKKEVQVVLHCAATISYAEALHKALDINTRATRLMLQLAREMNSLESFVHVSTAFSNCVPFHITENFYPGNLICSADKVLALRELCDNGVVDEMKTTLVDKFPNTYTYTKALAEQLIQAESGKLPLCIFRPGSIVGTSREPMSGWIDNIYGPISTLYGCVLGILRVAPIDLNGWSHIVPVDFCANLLLACARHTAKESTKSTPTIYNLVPHVKNRITNGEFLNAVEKLRNVYPFERSIWYPFLHTTSFYWLFKFASIFYHVLPGYTMDLVLRLQGQKPRMTNLYEKIHKDIDAKVYFTTQSWSFETTNTDCLWQSLSTADKELYEFNMRHFNWNTFFTRALIGMRMHLANEEPSDQSIKRAQVHLNRLTLYHRLLQFVLCCGAAFTVKWLATFLL